MKRRIVAVKKGKKWLPCLSHNTSCAAWCQNAGYGASKSFIKDLLTPRQDSLQFLLHAGHLELTILPDNQGIGSPFPSVSSRAQADQASRDIENTALLANMQQPQHSTSPASYKPRKSPMRNVLESALQPAPSAHDAGNATDQSVGGLHLPGDLGQSALQGQVEMPLDSRLHAALGPTGFMPPASPHPANSTPLTETHGSAPDPPMDSGLEDDGSEATTAQDLEHQALLSAHESSTSHGANSSSSRAGGDGAVKHRWHRDRQVQLTLAGYTSVCFVYILFDEMVPMYSSAPHQAGGLGLTPSHLALPLMASGPIMFVWSIWGYPFLEAWLGGITATMRWNLIAAAALTPLVPIASAVVPAGTTAVLLCLAVTLSFCRMIGNNMFSCASGLINLAAPKAQLGTVNAVGSLLSAGVRSVGPALGGFIWGSSVSIPAHQYAVFSAMSVIMLSILLVYSGVKV